METRDIGLMYLAEQTSPPDYKLRGFTVKNEAGAMWATFEAVLHSFDVLNRNRRIYDGNNVWDCITHDDRIQDGLRKRGWYGEQDHPGQNYSNMQLTAERVQKIDMDNRSHVIVGPHRSGNLLVSTIETCPGTDKGIGMCRDMIRGLIPSFSCRSIATMKYRGDKPYVVVKKVITYDWVLYPSHKEAEMITSPTIPETKRILVESAQDDSLHASDVFFNYSRDFYVPFSEFKDFSSDIIASDENLAVLTESGMYTKDDITGIDPKTNNIIIESSGSTLFVNTNRKTKKKVEDFLTSF